MTFLNGILLSGLIAVAIPILIHLFNRRQAKVIEWGAMQFLMGSIVNRRRRVLIEELVLMALRCLLVAILVLMVARPFAPVDSALAWGLLLPGLLLAALLTALAAIAVRRPWARALVYGSAIALTLGLISLSSVQNRWQASRWGGSSALDLVVILDGSTSMNVRVGEERQFDRAVDELRQLVKQLPRDTDLTLLVAGAQVRQIGTEPLDLRDDLEEVFDQLQPVGGTLNWVDALQAAGAALAQGDQPTKRVVLIGDGQGIGWEGDRPERWNLLADQLKSLPTPPQFTARFLTPPASFRNATVAELQPSRRLIGTDRPVTFSIRIENTGTESLSEGGLQFHDDSGASETLEVPALEPGQSVRLEVARRFSKPGLQAVHVEWVGEDDLDDDDRRTWLVQVQDRLPVLLIEGSGAKRFLDRASSFVEIALAPGIETPTSGDESSEIILPLVEVTALSAADLPDDLQFQPYRVVMLLDVPRLGVQTAEQLRDFVLQGGGLVIAPGSRAEAEFYREWKTADGRSVLPAELTERVVAPQTGPFYRPAIDSFRHPALDRVIAAGQSDLGKVDVSTYWKLKPADDPAVLVAGRLDLGDAWWVEHGFGKGKVVLLSTSLDDRGSSLPSSVAFLPLVHELTYDLAAPILTELNHEPAALTTLKFPSSAMAGLAADVSTSDNADANSTDLATADDTDASESTSSTDSTTQRTSLAIAPSGAESRVRWSLESGTTTVSVVGATEPGEYVIEVPAAFRSLVPTRSSSTRSHELPLSVLALPSESSLTSISATDEAAPKQAINWFQAQDSEQLVAAVLGNIPGHELWKILAVLGVIVVLAESLAARWVARRRKMGAIETVAFVSEGERLSSFKDRARELLETTRAG